MNYYRRVGRGMSVKQALCGALKCQTQLSWMKPKSPKLTSNN